MSGTVPLLKVFFAWTAGQAGSFDCVSDCERKGIFEMGHCEFDGRRAGSVFVAGVVLALSAIAISAPGDVQSSAYEKATKPAEAMVGEWDFAGASAAIAKLKLKDKALSDRLAARRDEVKRLAGLKTKIIEKANKLKPWLRRGPAVVPGTREIKTVGVQISKAGEGGVTVTEVTVQDKTSTDKPWSKLNSKEVGKLLKISISDNSTDDQLAAGLLALARSDAETAEGYFDKAKSLGAKTERYLGPLAAAAFARVNKLVDKKKFIEAGAALKAFEKKYAETPWIESHEKELTATRALVSEAAAEELYAQGVKLFKQRRFTDLKTIVRKLAKDYASSLVVIDENRKPTFAEMELAAGGSSKLVTVSKSGKAKHKTIQAAIKAAPPKSVIQIMDGATYEEELIIPEDKEGLVIRGKHGSWPVIKTTARGSVISVRAPRVTIQQVVIIGQVGASRVDSFSLREVISIAKNNCLIGGNHCEVDTCFLSGNVGAGYKQQPKEFSVKNSLILLQGKVEAGKVDCDNALVAGKIKAGTVKLQSCTLLDGIRSGAEDFTLLDSIISYVEDSRGEARIENCNVFGKGYLLLAKAGKGCIQKDPKFRDPDKFDYRLKPGSPCRRKASDGKDMGMRITPEMTAILKQAMALRDKGVIKF